MPELNGYYAPDDPVPGDDAAIVKTWPLLGDYQWMTVADMLAELGVSGSGRLLRKRLGRGESVGGEEGWDRERATAYTLAACWRFHPRRRGA